MNLVPDIRALLAVDVIASAQLPGDQRSRLWGELSGMLFRALDESEISPDEVLHLEPGGDSVLYTLPSARLGTIVDLTNRLDREAAQHNRWSKPTLRLRVSVHLGSVGQAPHYCSAKVLLIRLLEANQFKQLVNECIRQSTDSVGNSAINTGLIVSGTAFQEVFGGDHTNLVRPDQFAELEVSGKEFADKAWVRVPGVDSQSLAQIAKNLPGPSNTDNPMDSAEARPSVMNNNTGTMTNSVQTGMVHGGITFGRTSQEREAR